MRKFILAVAIMLMVTSNLMASDIPIKSLTEEKGTSAQCKAFIENEAQKLKAKGFKCRSVMGVVYVCDNDLFHSEWGCEGSEAWMEVFEQDGSDWKRFYR
ncbi:MAG: hypothetical protein JZU49_02600 [Sulfuricurvum sp.]|nr:hypothetical protein [Sulfuricurvum sp.]